MHEFDLEDPVEDMDEGDLRSTLDEFMTKHDENVTEYRNLESERDEFSETVEDLESEVASFEDTESTLTEKFAEVVAQESDLFDTDEVADRFSLPELLQKADSMGAFAVAAEETQGGADEDPDGEGGSTFDEKPGKAPTGSGGSSAFSDTAEDDLNDILGLSD